MLSRRPKRHSRSYGGGVLKLEPTEAEKVILPFPTRVHSKEVVTVLADVDALVRKKDWRAASALSDDFLLIRHTGLSQADVAALRQGLDILRQRRIHRAKRRSPSCEVPRASESWQHPMPVLA